jgi:glycosyltransferase involved in cell wall biosynthesis
MAKKHTLRVGYTTPGWPLKSFPNGIVAYVQNLTFQQEDKIDAVIFTDNLEDNPTHQHLVFLSKESKFRITLYKIIDKILNCAKISSVSIGYKRGLNFHSKAISQSIKQLDKPLDIIEIEESFGIAHSLVQKTNVPVVVRIHGPWFIHGPIMEMDTKPDYNLRVFYEGEAIKNAHGVSAPSLDVLDRVRKFYGIKIPNAKVIPNPVLKVPTDKHWSYVASRKPFILIVARFDLHKGGDLALDAFRIVALKNNEIELLFVGPDRGLSVNGKQLYFSDYLQQFIPEDNIKKRISFLGHCNQEKISELRKSSLATLICSRYENFPLSLLEALAHGCPTVATSVGGINEIIIDGYNGLLASVDSTEDIANKLLELIDNPEKMKELSKNAINDCEKRFSPNVVANQSLEFYQSVIKNRN